MKLMPNKRGFTLVELLVVMAIIAILATVGLALFTSSQLRGRDVERKSDLKQISNALALYYQDYGTYPAASSNQIAACPYNYVTRSGSSCAWGSGEFKDVDDAGNGRTIYMKKVPKDPSPGQNYVYVVSSDGKKFQLYAHLENTQDKNCINSDCTTSQVSYTCGGAYVCNFSITSVNASPTETLQ